jgi:hypothetical protein
MTRTFSGGATRDADKLDAGQPNPKQARGDKKLPLHRVPPSLMLYAAMAFGTGAEKYGSFNWRELPVETATYYSAALRHLFAWFDGEDFDPDSGNPHLAHAIASLAVLVDAIESGRVVDNRPTTGPAAAVIAAAVKQTATPAHGWPFTDHRTLEQVEAEAETTNHSEDPQNA